MTIREFEERFTGSFTRTERAFLWANEHFQVALKTFDTRTLEGLQNIERIGVALILQNSEPPKG